MDYLGHQGRPDLSDAEAARAFFAAIDLRLRHAAWFAHRRGEPLFSGLLDYGSARGRRVLDLGCGLAAMSGQLARHGVRVTSLDLTSTGATAAARRFTLEASPGVAVQGDAVHLPFADGSFDIVWSWGVLPHVADAAGAIAEVRRVLGPGGEFHLMVYNRRSIYNWFGIVARYGILRMQLLRYSLQELWNRYSDGRDVGGSPLARYYTSAQLEQMLAGFTIEDLRAFEQKTMLTALLPRALRPAAEARIPDALMRVLFRRLGVLLYCRARRTPGSTPATVPPR